jgi:hypothetical protein
MQRRVRVWACTATGIEHIKDRDEGRGARGEGRGYLYRRRSFNRDSSLIGRLFIAANNAKGAKYFSDNDLFAQFALFAAKTCT